MTRFLCALALIALPVVGWADTATVVLPSGKTATVVITKRETPEQFLARQAAAVEAAKRLAEETDAARKADIEALKKPLPVPEKDAVLVREERLKKETEAFKEKMKVKPLEKTK